MRRIETDQPEGRSAPRARYESLYRTLRERICLLTYPPGATLSESELAAEFNVSRTPIRRVLQALENEGLVETKQSVGTIVTSVDLKALRDVYAVRMVLAQSLGSLSPSLRPAARLTALRELQARAQRLFAARDFEEFVRINNDLQHEIGLIAGNEAFRRISEQLYYQTVRAYFQIVPELDWETEARWLHAEISEMLRALEANDPQALGYVRRNHISMNLVRITRYVLGHAGGSAPDSVDARAAIFEGGGTRAAAAASGKRTVRRTG